ncbi:hypothetical protein ACF0H5_019203 [Mactra antiquata]
MVDYVEPLWNETWKQLSSPAPNKESGSSPGPDPEQKKMEDGIVSVILCIFSVVGTLGNGLVFYVFTRTPVKLTSTIFILALALTDFVTCLVVIPYTVVAVQVEYVLYYDVACKIYMFLVTCIIPLSAFIMVAIAVDRYICICHPFAHIMTVKRAKIIVGILVLFSSQFGLTTALSYSVYIEKEKKETYPKVSIGRNYSVTANTTDEIIIPYDIEERHMVFSGVCRESTQLLAGAFVSVYQKIYSACYLCSLLIVLILYGLIYSSVTKQRAKRRAQKNTSRAKQIKQVNTHCQTDESTIPLKEANVKQPSHNNANHLTVEMDGETAFTKLSDTNTSHENGINKSDGRSASKASFQKQNQHEANKDKKDHNRLANIKTAVMLFIVTIVFLIAFLPAWLMALGWLDFNVIIFYMYFAYNIANPVIYAFMNQMFRENMCRLFSGVHSCCRGS